MHRLLLLTGMLLTANGPDTIYVRVGELQPVELHELKSVESADPSVADVSVYEPGVAMVTGHKRGTTELRWKDSQGVAHVTAVEVGKTRPVDSTPKPKIKGKLEVRVGGELLLPRCDLTRVESANPEIASVRAVSDLRAAVRALEPGVVLVTYWNSLDEPTTFEVTVLPSNAPATTHGGR